MNAASVLDNALSAVESLQKAEKMAKKLGLDSVGFFLRMAEVQALEACDKLDVIVNSQKKDPLNG